MPVNIPLRCKCRRQAITSLRCARCSVLICPDCAVITPAGMICKPCSNPNVMLHDVSIGIYAKSWVITFVVALVVGYAHWFIFTQMAFFGYLIAWFAGIGIAEIAKKISDRRRGTKMEIMAGVCTFVGFLIPYCLSGEIILNPMMAIPILIATASAVIRIRYI